MFEKLPQIAGLRRTAAVGLVIAAAVAGLGATFVAAAGLGSEGPRVAPIVINDSEGAEDRQVADLGPHDGAGGWGDDESDAIPDRPCSVSASLDCDADQGQSRPDPDVTIDRPATSPEQTTPGPVPTVPPPAPRSAVPTDEPIDEGDEDDDDEDDDTDEDDGYDDSDTSDDDDESDDDDADQDD